MTPKRRSWRGVVVVVAGTIDCPTSQQQQPIRRCCKRAPEPLQYLQAVVNPLMTLGSGSGHYWIKEEMILAQTKTGELSLSFGSYK